MKINGIEISHPHYPEKLKLNNFWLRDHCRCDMCFNYGTNQRRCNLLEIPLDIHSVLTKIIDDYFYVKWNDGHESKYEIKFIFDSQLPKLMKNLSEKKILWDKDLVTQLKYAKIDCNNLIKNDSMKRTLLESLINYGFTFVENVEPTTKMTEQVIRRLFDIQGTFFGEMWTFSDKKDHDDTAYTKEFLGPHNDNTYFNDASGLQILHCIEHSNGSGGESTLTDGFKILNDFKTKNPSGYEMLCNINVPAEYVENGQHHKYTAPIIILNQLTNQPEQIRLNVHDRAVFNTLTQEKMQQFYESFRDLVAMAHSPENQFVFKLSPGTVVIFDNWRLLHGRERYTGNRVMTGCYVSRSEYLSKSRQMNLID